MYLPEGKLHFKNEIKRNMLLKPPSYARDLILNPISDVMKERMAIVGCRYEYAIIIHMSCMFIYYLIYV